MKEIYDSVYNNFPNYDDKMDYKINKVRLHMADLSKHDAIIDIGCGKGHYARSIKSWGYDNYTAIELSTTCCNKFLTDVPHLNVDFLDYAPTIKAEH